MSCAPLNPRYMALGYRSSRRGCEYCGSLLQWGAMGCERCGAPLRAAKPAYAVPVGANVDDLLTARPGGIVRIT